MVLKEAFRMQNYLDSLLSTAKSYLMTDNVVSKKQEHLRTKSNADAENETVEVPKSIIFENENITPITVIDLVMDILTEKEKLTDAITIAKASTEINIDSSISLNKTRQQISDVLTVLSNKKASEKVISGKAYKFNADGEQVPYYYDINEVTTIDYDRNKVKAIVKKLTKDCDNVSAKIDIINVTTEVDYVPKYEIGDSFEDCLNKLV